MKPASEVATGASTGWMSAPLAHVWLSMPSPVNTGGETSSARAEAPSLPPEPDPETACGVYVSSAIVR